MLDHALASTLARPDGFDQRDFFSHEGRRTLVGPADLDAVVPDSEKPYLDEIERYWLNKPYSFAVIYHSRRENEQRYYAIEPHLTGSERTLLRFLDEQLRMEIDYESISTDTSRARRVDLIRDTVYELLRRYNLISRVESVSGTVTLRDKLIHRIATVLEARADKRRADASETVRSAPAIVDSKGKLTMLSMKQVETLTYYLVRDFVGYARIDPLKHDINVEDISCDGPDTELFIYHSKYEQLLTNISFDETALDSYVKRLANSSGKGISRRQPDVDTTLPDGSRAQLTLAEEITTNGSNFTIRQFLDIPFTPVDLINWRTFSLDQMAYLWLCIQFNRSVIFGGGTASGKTTTQNAVSLFIPNSAKIVSIEDTPELELPQKNWIASITRQSFSKNGMDRIDEYHLLENSLRQRPDYIIMGEVRGEEGRTLFQAMASGHTTFTTFHASTPTQVVQRFTTDPINVKKPYFDTLDLISMQRETRVDGTKVRRCQSLTEIGTYRSETDDVAMNDVYQWRATDDAFERADSSSVLDDIRQENGWTVDQLDDELRKRTVVLAYLITEGIDDYGSVAGTIQGFMIDERAILHLIESGDLDEYVLNLRKISSLDIDVDPEREALIPRPDAPEAVVREAKTVLEDAESLLRRYKPIDIGASFSLLDEQDDGESAPGVDASSVWKDDSSDPNPRSADEIVSSDANGPTAGAPRTNDGDTETRGETRIEGREDAE